ncbi:hypothetical protein [Methanochimaera problematica]|uniref:hypothetical protein n=1 Tax=Methanochimaera problematica TaxID=2609417 RepID=UPI0029393B50|nr:hypothetical protein [Methanoplanus sp. FWC-SCC4]
MKETDFPSIPSVKGFDDSRMCDSKSSPKHDCLIPFITIIPYMQGFKKQERGLLIEDN